MNEDKNPTGSVFDKDIETQFDTADVVASLMRIERSITAMNLTLAFGIGVLMYVAVKK